MDYLADNYILIILEILPLVTVLALWRQTSIWLKLFILFFG